MIELKASGLILAAYLLFIGHSATALASVSDPSVASPSCKLPAEITHTLSLDPACTYRGTAKVTASDTSLLCNGATIDATSKANGVLIKGIGLRNISVENCVVINAKKQGILVSAPASDIDMIAMPKAKRYLEASQYIRIIASNVRDSGAVGIYIDSYTQDALVANTTVSGSDGPGIYLEHSSTRTTVRDSVFTRNGFRTDETDGTRKPRREALAIDSSARNSILRNVFFDNGRGGIFLYKNCQENHTRATSVPRWMHSSYNTIAGNVMNNERAGVWVAARQSRNLTTMDCGDPPLGKGYFRDYADHNTIERNLFLSNDNAIRIEDDYTSVLDNIIVEPKISCVRLGSKTRDALLKTELKGSKLEANSCYTALPGRAFDEIGASQFQRSCSNAVNDDKQASCK